MDNLSSSPKRSFLLGLAQCTHPSTCSEEILVANIEQWCQKAKKQSVDMLVFPESLMTPFEISKDAFVAAAQTLEGSFCSSVNELAEKYGLWLVYTFNEKNEESDRNPYNSAVIVDDKGVVQGVYRKVHLFDTTRFKESEKMSSGNELFSPILTPFGKVGLGICYDLRFPEVARSQAISGCDLMLFPSAWVDGALKKMQWETLLAARAIENEMFVAGVSRVDKGYSGNSSVFGPDGVLLASGGSEEKLITARINIGKIVEIKSAMPVLEHRKPYAYKAIGLLQEQ